jgi:hypothetical protein
MKEAIYIVMENFSYFPPNGVPKSAYTVESCVCNTCSSIEILANTSSSEAMDAMARSSERDVNNLT